MSLTRKESIMHARCEEKARECSLCTSFQLRTNCVVVVGAGLLRWEAHKSLTPANNNSRVTITRHKIAAAFTFSLDNDTPLETLQSLACYYCSLTWHTIYDQSLAAQRLTVDSARLRQLNVSRIHLQVSTSFSLHCHI